MKRSIVGVVFPFLLIGALTMSVNTSTSPIQKAQTNSVDSFSVIEHSEPNTVARQPQALVVLINYSPWNTVIPQEPILALYNDGTVIYFKGTPGHGKYKTAKLSPMQTRQMLERVSIEKERDPGRAYASNASQNDSTEYILLRKGTNGTYQRIVVRGPIEPARTSAVGNEQPHKSMKEVFQYLLKFDERNSRDWIPDFFEVIVWPYEFFTHADLAWPSDLPDLSDRKTVRKGDRYSLFISKAKYREVVDLVSSLKEGQGLRISGKAWASAIRFPFPQEDLWSKVSEK